MSQKAGLIALLATLGFDHDSLNIDSDKNLHRLMNMTLQCLGGIRMIITARRKAMASKRLQASYIDKEIRQEEVSFDAAKKTFCSAVDRILSHISTGMDCDDLDPSKHLIESFPSLHAIGTSRWLPLHWAVLGARAGGPSDGFSSCDHPSALTNHPNGSITSSNMSNGILGSSHVDGRLEIVESIAAAYPHFIQQCDSEGRSYLHYACRLDSIDLVTTSLKISRMPICLSFINSNGAMPFHNSARFSQSLSLIKHMLQLQPTAIQVGNNDGVLPLHWAAAKSKNPLIIDELVNAYPEGAMVQNQEGYYPLHCSGQNTCLESVKQVLAAYPTAISMSDNEGGYPLHHACCFNSNVAVVKFMYEAYPGAINIPQQSGHLLPIHLATAQNESSDVLEYILSISPAAASAMDDDGWLPLHCLLTRDPLTMTKKRLDSLRILLKANPGGVHVQTISEGKSPIDIAITSHGPLVQRLVCNAYPRILNPNHHYHQLYRNLNWNTRRIGVEICYRTIHSSHTQSLVDGNEESSSLRYVIENLCYMFESRDSRQIAGGMLRQILLYL
jgi:ankyrin repeat protein